MAPSIIEGPVNGVIAPLKTAGANTTVPQVRRIIDEEGGKTTASVRHQATLP